MHELLAFLKAHWLSVFLIVAALLAILFVYKHKEKFEKNEFE